MFLRMQEVAWWHLAISHSPNVLCFFMLFLHYCLYLVSMQFISTEKSYSFLKVQLRSHPGPPPRITFTDTPPHSFSIEESLMNRDIFTSILLSIWLGNESPESWIQVWFSCFLIPHSTQIMLIKCHNGMGWSLRVGAAEWSDWFLLKHFGALSPSLPAIKC